jgi:hypothetical protein
MKKHIKSLVFATAVAGGMAVAPAGAQNPGYAPGDLVLGFQNPGGAQGSSETVLVSLGNTATVFRDATSNLINITNIGGALTTAFGANWWEASTLYMSIFGVWGTSSASSTLQNGDPQRTLYISNPRNSVGTPGLADSNAWTLATDTGMSTGATNIFATGNSLETQGTTATAQISTTNTQLDENNPFIGPGQQGTAYGVFPGGVQDVFGPGAFGNLGGVNAEAALDLYRIQARANVAGQYGFGGAIREGEYQGTVVIDQAGNVSFINAVPEPSTATLLGLAAGVCGFIRRRKSAA